MSDISLDASGATSQEENIFRNDPSTQKTSIYLYVLTALSCIGGFLFGYDTGVISGALVLIADDFNLSDVQQEFIVGITVGGAFLSSSLVGFFSDRYGRKPIIMASSVIFIIGSLMLSILAVNFTYLLMGRFIVGLGVGAASMIMPLYVCEASPTDIRGSLVTYINVAITFGQFFSACVDGGFAAVPNGWKYMLGFAGIPAAIQFIGFIFLPESPRWLIANDRLDDATVALRLLRSGVISSSVQGTQQTQVEDEIQEILASIRVERESELNLENIGQVNKVEFYDGIYDTSVLDPGNCRARMPNRNNNKTWYYTLCGTPRFTLNRKSSMLSKLLQKTVLRSLFLGCVLQAAQQFGGINTVMYYSTSILKIAGFTANSHAILLSMGVSFSNFCGSCVGLYLVDKVGRRSLTLWSLGSVCVFLLCIAVSFYFAENNSPVVSVITGGACGSYGHCFDCVQAIDCGFCRTVVSPSSIPSISPLNSPLPSSATDLITYPYLSPTFNSRSLFAVGSTLVSNSACLARDGNSWQHFNESSSLDGGGSYYSCASQSDFFVGSCPGTSSLLYGWLIFASLCLYLLAFAPGMGTMPWCINSEIYPTAIRGTAVSIATSVNWASNCIMSTTFLTIVAALTRQGAFLLYAVISIAFFIVLFMYLPETKGVPLEDIQEMFSDGNWGRARVVQLVQDDDDVDDVSSASESDVGDEDGSMHGRLLDPVGRQRKALRGESVSRRSVRGIATGVSPAARRWRRRQSSASSSGANSDSGLEEWRSIGRAASDGDSGVGVAGVDGGSFCGRIYSDDIRVDVVGPADSDTLGTASALSSPSGRVAAETLMSGDRGRSLKSRTKDGRGEVVTEDERMKTFVCV